MQDTASKPPAPEAEVSAASEDGAGAGTYYGLDVLPPPSAFTELAFMVGLLLVADYLWPALDLNNLQPSPYWFPVLLLTLQYGTASGMLAVIVAIAVYFSFVTLPEQGVGENEFAYRLRILAQPILWIGAAVVLGQFRMVQISAKRELRRAVFELEKQRDTLADYASRLRRRCDALERDIAARPLDAAPHLLTALAAAAPGHADPIEAVERLFATAFPDASLSLFVIADGVFTKAAASNWPARAGLAPVLPAAHPLTVAMIKDRARLCILSAGDDAALAGQGLAAVPVLDPATGAIVGMVKVEVADARSVTAVLPKQLDALAAAIAPVAVRLVPRSGAGMAAMSLTANGALGTGR